MEKHVFRQDHPYHKFGTGNYKTLWSTPKEAGRDPRQQLIEWWREHYCARRMKLAVAGKEDVETLEKWVRERFEAVPVRTEGRPAVGVNGVRIAFEENPIAEEQMGVSVEQKREADVAGRHLHEACPGRERPRDHLPIPRPRSPVPDQGKRTFDSCLLIS